MKVYATPLCSMLPSMTIEDGKETLATDGIEINNEGMCVFHGSPRAFIFRNTDLECRMVGRVTIEDLDI